MEREPFDLVALGRLNDALGADDVARQGARVGRVDLRGSGGAHLREAAPLGRRVVVVDVMRELMIRHTKSQRVHGEVALSLPDSECATKWLAFSPDEKFHRRTEPSAEPVTRRRPERSIAIVVSLLSECSKRKIWTPERMSHTQMRPISSPEITR